MIAAKIVSKHRPRGTTDLHIMCSVTQNVQTLQQAVLNPRPPNLSISMRVLAKVTLGFDYFVHWNYSTSVHINIELWGRGGCTG